MWKYFSTNHKGGVIQRQKKEIGIAIITYDRNIAYKIYGKYLELNK